MLFLQSVLVLGLAVLILVSLRVFRNRVRVARLLKRLPAFKPLPAIPLLGSALLFKDTSPDGVLRTLVDCHRRYGKNLLLQVLCNEYKLLVSEPRVVEQVIQAKTIQKAPFYAFLKPWLGMSTVVSSGQQWSNRRKLINPAFHYKMLEDFLDVMVAQSDVLVTKLAAHVGGDDFDVYLPLRYCAMDIICETAMGIQLHCQSNPTGQIISATEEIIDLVHKRVFDPVRGHTWVYPFTHAGHRTRKTVEVLHNFTNSVIRERRQYLLDLARQHDGEGEKPVHKMTFLDLLLETQIDGKPLPEDDIRGEVSTFMFAGHETTTSCLSFVLYYLSRYPEVQQKVYDEIKTIHSEVGDLRNARLTYTSSQELRYLEMVIKETLRLNPSAPMVGRSSCGDMVIDGVTIPAGTEVMLQIYVMQTDPDNFPEPDKFIPERFAESASDDIGFGRMIPYSFIPFSAGSRSCIGQRYAMLEMKTILVKLLTHYRVLASSAKQELRVKADLTLKPYGGAFIKLVERFN
ncbi:cytochrome P450 [Anopheles darlingi]|uniref:Cytochrome P450 n=1 Tax=Anopheles darlingi TaxID=43151 RepID=W5JRW6_ANODA|nr:cytochrome P450 [Anopheles darlingi]